MYFMYGAQRHLYAVAISARIGILGKAISEMLNTHAVILCENFTMTDCRF